MATEGQRAPGTDRGQPKEKGQKEGIYDTGEYDVCLCVCVCVRAHVCVCLKLTGLLWSRSRHPRLGLRALTQNHAAAAISPLL